MAETMNDSLRENIKQGHHINKEKIKLLCFHVLNIVSASKTIVESRIDSLNTLEINESGDESLSDEGRTLLELHKKFTFSQISELLLQVSVMVRTFDDIANDSENGIEYKSFKKSVDCYIGHFADGKAINLREACNKIIHASLLRLGCEKYNVLLNHNKLEDGDDLFGHLSGDVYLEGRFAGKKWEVTPIYPKFRRVSS